MNWIKELLESTEEFESPRAFFLWSGLAAISAVVKDSVYIDRHLYKLYPNVYIMLMARSGLRKGPPIALAKDLVNRVGNTRVISGRSSIEAIVKELGTATTKPGGRVIKDSAGFIVASEFSSSLIANAQALTILTDLYDRIYNEGEWKNLMKQVGVDVLKNPTITSLVATNQAHFRDFVGEKDVMGGYIARTFIISADRRNRINALVRKPSRVPDREKLAEYLKELSKLSGEFSWADGAGEAYEDWYDRYTELQAEDETGTAERIGDSVLKVAMLMSLSRAPDLILSKVDVEQAISVSEDLLFNAKRSTVGKGKSELAAKTAVIIEYLLNRSDLRAPRQYILRDLWGHVDYVDLDRIMETLISAGAVARQEEGSNVWYMITSGGMEQLRRVKGA